MKSISKVWICMCVCGVILACQTAGFAADPVQQLTIDKKLARKGKIYRVVDSSTLVINDMTYRLSPDTSVLDSDGKTVDSSMLQKGVFVEFMTDRGLISVIAILESGWELPGPSPKGSVAPQSDIILEDGVWKN